MASHDSIERMTYATGVNAINADTLSQISYKPTGVSDGVTYGYIANGYSAGYLDLVDRMTFSTSGIAAHTDATISEAKAGCVGISDNVTYGYITNGWTSTTADRITFSTGVAASHTDALPVAVAGQMAMAYSDGTTYGYMVGGYHTAENINDGERLTFSTGVMAAHSDADISTVRSYLGAFSDGAI